MRSDFGFGLLIGILGGMAAALVLAALTNIWGATDGAWLYRWQTLVTGIAALAGALLTVRMIERQVQQTDHLEQERVARKAIAARVLLPNALASLSDYAEECIVDLRKIYAMTSVVELGEFKPAVPKQEVMDVLSSCVEWDDSLRTPLIELTAHLQVQQSRIQDIAVDGRRVHRWGTTKVGHDAAQFILDALELHVRCEAIFSYARGEAKGEPGNIPYKDDIQRATRLFRIGREAFPLVHTLIDYRFAERPLV